MSAIVPAPRPASQKTSTGRDRGARNAAERQGQRERGRKPK